MTTRTPEERFWSKVNKTETCWLWTGALDPWGHGRFIFYGKNTIASRVAWILTYGPLLPGFVVCHLCSNKACVYPAHLAIGTQSDNVSDGNRKPRGEGRLMEWRRPPLHTVRFVRVPKPKLDPSEQRCTKCGIVKPKITAFHRKGIRYGKQTYQTTCKDCRRDAKGWEKRPTTLEEAFWKYAIPGKRGKCWEWTGSRVPFGYGQVGFQYRVYFAHVLSFTLHYGPVPPGIFVCHACNNPPCWNPEHLWLGTIYDNNENLISY